MEELSANNWMRYRDDIAVSIMRVAGRVAHADAAARPAKAAQPALPLSALGMLRDLYDKMSIQEKAAFEEEHKDASEVMAIVRRKECKGCGKGINLGSKRNGAALPTNGRGRCSKY